MTKYIVTVGFIIVMGVGVGLWLQYGRAGGSSGKPDYEKVIGDWVRPDGGYVIRISNIDPDGQAKAFYFNPKPINVSKALVASVVGRINVFVELQDEGYPGSNYNLTYDPVNDMLSGTYFQAQMQQIFEVAFQRTKSIMN